MDFYETVKKRRTIRKFKGPATPEQLERILEAGSLAPSRRNTQAWKVLIVDDLKIIEKITEVKYNLNRYKTPGVVDSAEVERLAKRQKDSFPNASLILVYYDILPTKWIVAFDAASAWLMIENICLAAVAEGLGARIATFWEGAEQEVGKLVQAPDGIGLAAAISIGIPDIDPGPRTLKRKEKWLFRNHF